jgi:hypothetical protein
MSGKSFSLPFLLILFAKQIALSFFKIPGMSTALLQVLTLPRIKYKRIQAEMGCSEEYVRVHQQ